MCRDLSGRRLADIKEEEKLRKWIEKASEREEEKRRQKYVFYSTFFEEIFGTNVLITVLPGKRNTRN